MKIRMTALFLTVCLTCGLLAFPASAAESDSGAVQTIQALGIMSGDGNGNLNLSGNVTRAQFAAMLTAASSYKDSVSTEGSGYSLFKDVKSSHWASEYIRLALEQGWMTGYTDGTFRPDQTVKLEEACTAVLKLLGYDSASLAGSFPNAQLSKASSLGLRDQISLRQGETMTRRDCVNLFYNLLTAKTASGQVYATTLGYTVTNGTVDYTEVVMDSLSGPYVAQNGSVSLAFQPTTIYRNGKSSTSSAISQYDVYYYNEGMSSLWIYTNRVSGKITELSPSSTSPTSVTVSGVTYQIGTAEAAYKLSALGGGGTGNYVTVLLGMNDAVVDVMTGTDVNTVYYGVVQSCTRAANQDEAATVQTSVTVVCTDGVTRTFTVNKDASYTTGKLIYVTVTDSGITIRSLSEKSTSGKVNSSATKLGDLTFADDIEILDTSDDGGAAAVEASRLAGCSLSSGDIRYYGLDEDGKIEYLILDDATGDLWTYAYMTDVNDQSQEMNTSVSYTYLVDGTKKTIQSSGTKYAVETGGVAIGYKADGSIRTMRGMQSVKLTNLTGQQAMSGNKKYTLAEDIQIYLRSNGAYYLTTLSAVNGDDYTLTGWYDNSGSAAGGQIRIIIAVEKSS